MLSNLAPCPAAKLRRFPLLATLLLAVSAPCQLDTAAHASPAAADAFVFEPGVHDPAALVDRVAAYLGYEILCNPRELEGVEQVHLHRRTEVDRRGCWELAGMLLFTKGLAFVPLDPDRGFYEVVATKGPRAVNLVAYAIPVDAAKVGDYARLHAIPIRTYVQMEHCTVQIAVNALRGFSSRNLTIGSNGSDALLLQGLGPDVFAAVQLTRLVDVDRSPAARVVRLEHSAAEDIGARLHQTLVRTACTAAAESARLTPTLGVEPHPALNALILTGSEAEIRAAEGLIAKLDAPATTRHHSVELANRLMKLEERIQALGAVK